MNGIKGLVIKNTGSLYTVLLDGPEGRLVNCRAKGNFRIRGLRTTNPVAVGDHVKVAWPKGSDDTSEAYIVEVEPRRNYIIRRASNLSKEAHIIAANIDLALLVVTLAHPEVSTVFIDRFLATAEAYSVEAILVINKVDLFLAEPEGSELLDAVSYLYRSLGYKVYHVSALSGEGIESLREELAAKVTLLSGNSGVGKSTLINRLIPGLTLRTAEISAVHDTGMHTTTFSEMFPLPGSEGGWLIDTPGVKGFGTIDIDPREAGHYFREIFKASDGCRYGDCTHTHEPGCAVREALERNEIAQSRYASYLSIMEDGAEDKYRKPF